MENLITAIKEKINVLEKDKEDFLKDIEDIDDEINLFKTELEYYEEDQFDNDAEDFLNDLETYLELDALRPNVISDEEVNLVVGAVYLTVADAIAVGVDDIAYTNGDYDENSSEEHKKYVAVERTRWLTQCIINELQEALDNIIE